MEKRRLGLTNLHVSVVGFGTCQLRLVPHVQAVDTLLRSFDLGVNLVHTAPDYEGAETIVAEAVKRTRRKVIVASQGYDIHGNLDGPVRHFESLFEATCARLRTDRLDLYGIACVDDREAYRENVWGKGGMVEFLQRMKNRGRLGATFCTTHGNPEYIKKLVQSGAFDAVMVAYNALGFHLLSYSPPAGRHFESLPRNRLELFPLCQEHDVGLMIMKPLAGGLLCAGKAFPARKKDEALPATARDVLRTILASPEVTCVIPGTASVAEAEENARAGHAPLVVPEPARENLNQRITLLQTNLCSRCGLCDTQCSQKLPASWMFRAAYVALHPSETFETWDAVEYFRLHPREDATCATCPSVTCHCPYGVDIPKSLTNLHGEMMSLMGRGLIAPPESAAPTPAGEGAFRARVLIREFPGELAPGEKAVARVWVENAGARSWFTPDGPYKGAGVVLAMSSGTARLSTVALRHDVHPGERCHFVFPLQAPAREGPLPLRLQLLAAQDGFCEKTGPVLFDGALGIRRSPAKEAAKKAPRPPKPPVAPPYAVEWLEHNLPDAWPEGSPFHLHVRLRNIGSRTWVSNHPEGKCVDLVARIDGALQHLQRVPCDIGQGQEVLFSASLVLPPGTTEMWEVSLLLVEQNVAWFADQGAPPLTTRIARRPRETGPTAELQAIARQSNSWSYSASQGISRGRDGRAYPLFVREALGSRVRDAEGNEWIDYVMGWGSVLLGHAHPEVSQAVARQLNSGAIVSLPHELEMHLTRELCSLLPGAESVLFGKNGSDVCTAAVRMARLFTSRRKVLFSGYHGWHDWYAQSLAPELGAPAELFRFRLNDLNGVCRLFEEHHDVAAVMLEPAGQVEGVDGPVREVDPAFLVNLAAICRERGALLIFDEVLTGMRYRQGSVQKACGVVPDLSCFGKALSSGMPLSALVGRREIFERALGRAFYHPTFKGEAYSMAAALAALQVYRSQDVSGHVAAFGTRLADGINRVAKELGIDGGMTGLPFRMVYRFSDRSEPQLTLKRTLLIQELLKGGVLTFRGFMLPSLAHGDAELSFTLEAFRIALTKVRDAESAGALVRALEIPLVR